MSHMEWWIHTCPLSPSVLFRSETYNPVAKVARLLIKQNQRSYDSHSYDGLSVQIDMVQITHEYMTSISTPTPASLLNNYLNSSSTSFNSNSRVRVEPNSNSWVSVTRDINLTDYIIITQCCSSITHDRGLFFICEINFSWSTQHFHHLIVA